MSQTQLHSPVTSFLVYSENLLFILAFAQTSFIFLLYLHFPLCSVIFQSSLPALCYRWLMYAFQQSQLLFYLSQINIHTGWQVEFSSYKTSTLKISYFIFHPYPSMIPSCFSELFFLLALFDFTINLAWL